MTLATLADVRIIDVLVKGGADMTTTSAEQAAMRRAIVLSAFGLGTTSPNPPVGCVVLDRTGRAVGEGYHVRKGEAHAEVQALRAAGERACGGTAVVTLEPCDHHGRTPPCHQAIIDSGVRRVLIALLDHSRGGGGVAQLRQAGLEVVTHVLAEEARLVLCSWLTAVQQQRPFVTWMYAVPTDALAGGLSTAASAPFREASADAHCLRLAQDVVLYDDGELCEGNPGGHKPEVFRLTRVNPRQEPPQLLASLLANGVHSLLLDGSLSLASPFLAAGCVDQAIAYIATSGSSSAVPPATAAGLVADFALHDVTRLGNVVRVRSRPVPLVARTRRAAALDPLSGGWSVRSDWASPEDREPQ